VVQGQVTRSDVKWKLRTRLDVIPSMVVREGHVTGWLREPLRQDVLAFAEVESPSMQVRAWVAPEDLAVVLREPTVVLDSLIPDGVTDHRVIELDAAHSDATVEVVFAGLMTTATHVPCDELGLERKDIGTGALLPPSRGDVVVRHSATIEKNMLISRVTAGSGARKPDGVLAELRGDDIDHGARLVSIRTCGGTLFGKLPKSDLLGAPTLGWGSSFQCPNTGEHFFVGQTPIDSVVTCKNAIPVFVQTATLRDPVGTLTAGASVRIDGPGEDGAVRITVPDSPVMLLGTAHFVVNAADVASCAAPP